jgi:hypothetical protein
LDVANDASARDKLFKLGPKSVPVLAKGSQYIFCQNLEDVAEFVGLAASGHTPLPPEILIVKWLTVLRAASRYVRQFPNERLAERAIETRDRSIRLLSHHIFRIGEAFLEVAIDGVEYWAQLANVPPEDGTYLTGNAIAGYGNSIIERLEQWWDGLEDKSCRQKVRTFYGEQPAHQLLERSTWHSAQHTRQINAVLGRLAIDADGPLTDQDYAGLPLPEGLWD